MERTVKSQTDKQRPSFLILGAGYSAKALIPALLERGFDVFATTRTQKGIAALEAMGTKALLYDTTLSEPLSTVLKKTTHILSSIPPTLDGDPFIQALKKAHPKTPLTRLMPAIEWAGYFSATSVYGDRDGQWVFEQELLAPKTQRGKNRARAELEWLETGLAVHVFRLAGIYGPGRNPFQRLRTGKARAVIKEGHIVNRIHVDDITRIVLASLDHPDPVSLYNVADDYPAPPQDVLDFAANLIGVSKAKRVDINAPEVSEMARSFYEETKRVSNDRAKRKLGWSPKYPNYKLGLMSVLKSEFQHPNAVILTGYMDIPKADLKSVKLAMPTHIRLSNQETDCEFFNICQDSILPTRFHVYEIFKTQTAYKRHQDRMKHSEWALVTQSASRHYDSIGLNERDLISAREHI